METSKRAAILAFNKRWLEIEVWRARALALGLQDVADGLLVERLDACQDEAEAAKLVERARAACLLRAFHADDSDSEREAEARRVGAMGPDAFETC